MIVAHIYLHISPHRSYVDPRVDDWGLMVRLPVLSPANSFQSSVAWSKWTTGGGTFVLEMLPYF